MKKAIKLISLLCLTISFIISIADYTIFLNSNSNHIVLCKDCPDIPDYFEHFHSHSSEENVLINDSNQKNICFFDTLDFIPITDINIKNNFIPSIWQPPKFS